MVARRRSSEPSSAIVSSGVVGGHGCWRSSRYVTEPPVRPTYHRAGAPVGPGPQPGRGDFVRTLVWRRLDEPGMEVAHIRSLSSAAGVQIGRTYELQWRLEKNRLDLEVDGERRETVLLEDADFFDVFASPFFNSLPVMRDGLLESGPPRDYAMRFVHVPDLTVESSAQRYEPLGERVVRYRSGDFESDIAFDADGFVVHYGGFVERVSWSRCANVGPDA